MARFPEAIDGITLDLSGLPGGPPPVDEEPCVGDIYRPRAGQPGYWWIVGITQGEFHHTALYLTFNLRGELVGQGRAGMHYIRERQKVGRCEIPAISPEWY